MTNKKCRHEKIEPMADGGVIRCLSCGKTWIRLGKEGVYHSSRYKAGGA
jgi:hypothetical protein